jgi:hypothetical protein
MSRRPDKRKHEMKEPVSLRISDSTDPKRGEKFEQVLKKRRANAADVLRGLVQAYIDSDGDPAFPWMLKEAESGYGKPKKR